MILSLNLPKVGSLMREGTVHRLVARVGDELRPGSPILELRVDLGVRTQDCPPLFFFKIVATERAVLRALNVTGGQVLPVGSVMGIVTSTALESAEGQPARALRTMSVAIQVDPLSRR